MTCINQRLLQFTGLCPLDVPFLNWSMALGQSFNPALAARQSLHARICADTSCPSIQDADECRVYE